MTTIEKYKYIKAKKKFYQFCQSFVERRPPPGPKIKGEYLSLMTTFQPLSMKRMASLNGLVGRY